MNASSASISVASGEQEVCIKISGRANFTTSVPFKSLFNEWRQRGRSRFVIDLTDCLHMDSTFLGTLAGLGKKLGQGDGQTPPASVQLLNPNAHVFELLDNLGVVHLFNIFNGVHALAEKCQPCSPAGESPTRADLTRACFEAHQTLMDVNPDNVPKFSDATQFFKKEIKDLDSKGDRKS